MRAPRRLRLRTEAMSRASRRRPRWMSIRPAVTILPGAMAGALLAALLAAALLPAGPAAPTLSQAAAFSQRDNPHP